MAPSPSDQTDSILPKKLSKRVLRAIAKEFIITNRAASLATIDEQGIPHVVIVYCIVAPDLSLYFSTRVEGRKYRNMMSRPIVSMAFSNEQNMSTVQLTGTAERVNQLEQEQEILGGLIALRYGEPNWPVPPVKMFERGATNELAIIKITPTEMVYANFQTSKDGRYKPFFHKVI